MADTPENKLSDLLNHLEKLDDDLPVSIKIGNQDEKWVIKVSDLKNILMGVLFENPALRKENRIRLEANAALQEQMIEGETLSFEPPNWEYRWVESDFDELDEIGADGWEAVLISGPLILFKRPK